MEVNDWEELQSNHLEWNILYFDGLWIICRQLSELWNETEVFQFKSFLN